MIRFELSDVELNTLEACYYISEEIIAEAIENNNINLNISRINILYNLIDEKRYSEALTLLKKIDLDNIDISEYENLLSNIITDISCDIKEDLIKILLQKMLKDDVIYCLMVRTGLPTVIENNDIKVFNVFYKLAYFKEICEKYYNKRYALIYYAVRFDNYEIFKELLALSTIDELIQINKLYQASTLHEIFSSPNEKYFNDIKKDAGIIRYLNIKDKSNQTLLHFTSYKGYMERSKLLYDNMTIGEICTPMMPEKRHQTCLHFAVQGNHIKIVQLLLTNKEVAKKLVGIIDHRHQTPLHWASSRGNYEICKLIYEVMTVDEICKQNSEGYNVLHMAKTDEIYNFFSQDENIKAKLLSST